MDSKPVILLLGATGQMGKLLAENLRDNDSLELRVASRKQDQLAELAKQYKKSVYIDLDNPQSFSNALQGVNRLFLLTSYSVAMLVQSKTIIDAAKKAGVEHIVHLGVFSPAWDCTAPHFAWHQIIEVYIKHSQIKWTFLHLNCFFQNLTNFSVLNNRKFRWYTSKPCGWIALEDAAEAAAKILVEGPDKHHGKDYWFSTESLDANEVTKILSQITQKKMVPDVQPAEQFIKDLGADPKTIDPYFFSVAEACQQIEDGRMSYIGDVKDDIQILLNRKGLSLSQWAEKHKSELMKLVSDQGKENMQWGG